MQHTIRAYETPPDKIHHPFNHLCSRPASEQPVVSGPRPLPRMTGKQRSVMRRHLLPNINPIQAALRPSCSAFASCPPGAWPQNKTFPTVLMLPPDIFKLESADDGVPTERQASYDLQVAGFLVFQVDHRLAPPGRSGASVADR